MEVVDAKQRSKALLQELIGRSPADHDLPAIWNAWIERMADGVHLVYLTPKQLADMKQCFDDAYAELIATKGG